jgi:peptide/nickel transport system substrate-binding protein
MVGSSVLEPLAAIGPDKSAKPWLADSWIADETFDRWVIHLHPNVKFQNGEDFNADVAKKNIEFYLHGTLSKIALEPMIAGVDVIDPLTIQVNLKQPWGAFPGAWMMGNSYMMAPAMLDSADHGIAHPIGTGPFTFDSWQSGTSFKVKKNPNYWQAGLPHLDSIEFRVIPDETSRVAALTSGDVNMILTTRAADATDLANTNTVVKDWSTENAFVMTNTSPQLKGKDNPLADPDARKALAYATDRDAVAALIGEGIEIPTSPWSPSSPWGMPDDQNGYVNFDLDQAKAEVEAYKKTTGASSLTFTLSGLPGIDDIKVLQLLQSQWKDVGIDAKIETLEQTAYITKAATGDYQAAFFRNYGYSDPDMDYYFWSSSTAKGVGTISINFTQFTTPALDGSLKTGRESGYVDIRKKAYDDLTRELNSGFTNIWLYRTPYSLIAEKQVRGLNVPRTIAFGNLEPKTWLADLWRAPSDS